MQGLRVALADEVDKLNAGVHGGVLWDSEENKVFTISLFTN